MQFVRYERNGALRLGALAGDDVVDLLDAAPNGTAPGMLAAFSEMTLLIAAGEAGLAAARAAIASVKLGKPSNQSVDNPNPAPIKGPAVTG